MNKIISFIVFFTLIFISENKQFRRFHPSNYCSENGELLSSIPQPAAQLCASDGKTYKNPVRFECFRNSTYGKSVNLHEVHMGSCYPFEEWLYSLETTTILLVS